MESESLQHGDMELARPSVASLHVYWPLITCVCAQASKLTAIRGAETHMSQLGSSPGSAPRSPSAQYPREDVHLGSVIKQHG